MPMEPLDVMWMSKPPTVSDVMGRSTNVTFKSAVSPIPVDDIRPDFDTDVLWKPPRISRKTRTISMESTDSEAGRKFSINEGSTRYELESLATTQHLLPCSIPTSPVDVAPRQRRMSFTEMIFGSPQGGFSWGQSNLQNADPVRKGSVTDDSRFKELMRHQNKILGDDGISGGFKMRDYVKND